MGQLGTWSLADREWRGCWAGRECWGARERRGGGQEGGAAAAGGGAASRGAEHHPRDGGSSLPAQVGAMKGRVGACGCRALSLHMARACGVRGQGGRNVVARCAWRHVYGTGKTTPATPLSLQLQRGMCTGKTTPATVSLQVQRGGSHHHHLVRGWKRWRW